MKTINSSPRSFFLSFLIFLLLCCCGLYAKPLKRHKPDSTNQKRSRTFSQNFSEVEIAISEDLTLADISALPKAPGSKLEVMKNSKRVRVQLPTGEVETLAEKGADIKKFRQFVLFEASDSNKETISQETSLATSSNCYSFNNNIYYIPDDGFPDYWANSTISISCAPPGETVTSVDVHYEIDHTWVSEVYVDFTDEDQTYAHLLWYFEGGSANDISETETGISTFNGEQVNQTWILWAADDTSGDDGFIDSWWIKVYYDGTPATCSVEGYKFDDTDGNGVWDQNEPGLQDWEIYLDLDDNDQRDAGEPNTVTDIDGFYEFTDLDPATYIVAEVMKTGWTQTYPGGDGKYTIIAEEGMAYDGNNFGNTTLQATPKITGHIMVDGRALTGVAVSGQPGDYSDVTDSGGYYEITVTDGWSGTVTANKDRYEFNEVHTFSNLTSDTVADFTAYCIYSGGDGTETTPFQIADVVDLLALGENTSDYTKHFIQTANISLAGAGQDPCGTFPSAVIARSTTGNNFNGVRFEGIYDGKGFTISDLSIDATTSKYDYLGLFGKIDNGLIKNLNLENISIVGDYIQYVGGLVGENDGSTIANCKSSVLMEAGISCSYFGGITGYNDGGTTKNCSSSGSISGTIGTAGGIAGGNDSLISGCNSSCSVAGNIYLGGLVGINGGTILNSFATGDVSGSSFYYYFGGLVGDNDNGLISNCYATGAVSGRREIGGLAGRNYFDGTIVNCYATGQVDGDENVGGLVGINEDINEGVISHCYAAGDVSGTTAVGGLCGYNPDNHFTDPTPIIVNCFWDTSVQTHGVTVGIGINNELVLNVLGKTTGQMQMQSTFTDYDWDFVDENDNGCEDFWRMCIDGQNYPKLNWKFTKGDIVCPDGVELNDLAELTDQWLLKKLSFDVSPAGGDGIVALSDWAVFANNWQADMAQLSNFMDEWLKEGIYNADIAPQPNGDGTVNFLDFAIIAKHWLEGI
jgi:hypothetical protein